MDPEVNARWRTAPRFTRRGVEAGALRIVPILPSVAMYGIAFGIMAASARLSLAESVLFSAWVYAGAAQMATLQAWSDPVPILAVVATTLGMNARYLLLGATLRPWLRALPPHQVYPSLFVLGDGNWALALKERERGLDDAGFLLGSGLAMWATWVLSTGVGHAFGSVLREPERFGVDFMLAAFFASMAVAFLKSIGDLLPFLVGAAAAVVFERVVPGPWSLLIGALAGSGAAALRHARSH